MFEGERDDFPCPKILCSSFEYFIQDAFMETQKMFRNKARK